MKNFLLNILFAFVSSMVIAADAMTATTLVEARGKVSELYSKQIENLFTKSQYIQALMLMADQAQLKLKEDYVPGRTLKAEMLRGEAYTVNTARTCTPSGSQPITATVTLSPFTATSRFRISKTQLYKNDYNNMLEVMARLLWNAENSVLFNGANSLNGKIATAIASFISATNAGNGYGGTLEGSIMEVDYDNIASFYSLLASHMDLNNYAGTNYTLVSSTQFKYEWNKASKLGLMTNGIDSPDEHGIKQLFSNSIVPSDVAYNAEHFLIVDGAVGMANFIDPLFMNFDSSFKAAHTRMVYPSSVLPGLNMMLKRVDACTDTSATGGQVDDDTMQFELSLDAAVYQTPSTNKGVFQYATKKSGIV
jgi:hypothetical protein